MNWKKIFYLLLVMAVAGVSALGGVVAGGMLVYQTMSQAQPTEQVLTTIPALNAENQSLTIDSIDVQTAIIQVAKNVGPAVVTVVGTSSGQMTFFGSTVDQTVSGSGVFISKDGYILTNNHVVEDTTEINIVLSDGTQEKAQIVGTDRFADLAVLKTEGQVPAYAALGNSDLLDPGETVIAIGSPLGDFKNSVTVGVISGSGRSIDTGEGYQIEGLIQTDAAINQGNSGGPLVNLAGEVIGINTLVVRGSGTGAVAEGLGFAIPANTAQAVTEQIIQKGYFSRPSLGIRYQTITPRIAAMYNLPVEWGIYVTEVASGGPADKAGMTQGDIITQIGDTVIDGDNSFINILFGYRPGDQVTVEVNRNGQTLQVEAVLGEASA